MYARTGDSCPDYWGTLEVLKLLDAGCWSEAERNTLYARYERRRLDCGIGAPVLPTVAVPTMPIVPDALFAKIGAEHVLHRNVLPMLIAVTTFGDPPRLSDSTTARLSTNAERMFAQSRLKSFWTRKGLVHQDIALNHRDSWELEPDAALVFDHDFDHGVVGVGESTSKFHNHWLAQAHARFEERAYAQFEKLGTPLGSIEGTHQRIAGLPEDVPSTVEDLRTKLTPQELRNAAEIYFKVATEIYNSLAEGPDVAAQRSHTTSAVEEQVSSAEKALNEAAAPTEEVRGGISSPPRSAGTESGEPGNSFAGGGSGSTSSRVAELEKAVEAAEQNLDLFRRLLTEARAHEQAAPEMVELDAPTGTLEYTLPVTTNDTYGSREIGELLSPTNSGHRSIAKQRRESNELLGVKVGNQYRYPKFQVDTERKEIIPIVAYANRRLECSADPWGALDWWYSPEPSFHDSRPVDLLLTAEGISEKMVDIAFDLAEQGMV